MNSDAAAADAGSDARASGIPPEIADHTDEWPTANHDYGATRAATGSSINRANAATLVEAWSFELPSGGFFGAATAEPLVVDGTVYYVDMRSNVFAVDFQTGAEKWRNEYDMPTSGPNGVAAGWGKLFVATSDRTFAALSAETGEELWAAKIDVPENGGIDLEPVAYDGLVYLSTVPVTATTDYDGNAAGILYALDQASGEIVWSFNTVKDGDLWGNPTLNSGGGAWYSPSIDTETGQMYWGVGNPGPYPGIPDYPNGASRPGDNLYTSSVVALSHDEGKLDWYHQEVPHDLFDHDFQNPPVLASVSIAGAARDVAFGSGKVGTVVALDRSSGELLWRTPVGTHENDELTEIPAEGVAVYPGDLGGVETPLAYADGLVFAAVVNWSRVYYPTKIGDQGESSTGELVALDAASGEIRWKVALDAPAFGSATIANDVVFTSTFDGTVLGFATADGSEVFRYSAPLGINAPPVIVGDTLIVAAGSGLGVPALIALRLP